MCQKKVKEWVERFERGHTGVADDVLSGQSDSNTS
jgi:hypothetical protein